MNRRRPEPDLRFGLLCADTTVRDYVAVALGRLRGVEGVSLSALVTPDDESDAGQSNGGSPGNFESLAGETDAGGTTASASALAWDLYLHLSGTPASERPVDLSEKFEGVARIPCDPDRLREFDLDFLFAPSVLSVEDAVLDVPRYGVWSYADHGQSGDGVRHFTEISDDVQVTEVSLYRFGGGSAQPVVLRTGVFPTIPSYAANVNQARYGSAKWPAQVATDVLNGHDDYLERGRPTNQPPMGQKPTVRDLSRYFLRVGRSKAEILTRGVSDWNVGVVDAPVEASRRGGFGGDVEWYDGRVTDGFVADPFACEIGGSTYVFVEEYSHETEKGRISYVEYADGFGARRPALEEPFHVSYPYLFEYDGTIFATPETKAANEIRLYRVDEPDDWNLERVLRSDVRVADPTVVKYDDHWWLFCTRDGAHTSTVTDLELYHAPAPTARWEPHENNPVKTDVRSARPGGTPFVSEGTLYRPTQNCAGGYGQSVVVNRVDELSTTGFAETSVATVSPDADGRYPDGRHTVSACGDVTMIDGKRMVYNEFAWRQTRRRIRSKIGL